MRHALARSSVRRSLAVLLPVIALGATLGAPSVARADEPAAQDVAQARQLGQQASAAFDAGNYAESEKLWNAATRLYPLAPTLTLGLARTQAKLGKLVAAQESYNKIVREWADKPNPQPAFKDALEAAKTEGQAVSARVASVTISLDGTVPPNAQVTIDGQPVNTAALGLRRPVDPGTHQVKASAEGYKPAETSFEVKEGGSAEAKLRLEKDPNAAVAGAAVTGGAGVAAAGTPGTEAPPPEKPATGSNKTLAIAAFGVGGAGLLLGAITGFVALGKNSDLEKVCQGGTCPASAQGDVDSYNTMGTLSTVGFIVAGVGGVAGAVLLLTSPKQTGAAGPSRYATVKTSPTITPYLGLGGGGVTGSF